MPLNRFITETNAPRKFVSVVKNINRIISKETYMDRKSASARAVVNSIILISCFVLVASAQNGLPPNTERLCDSVIVAGLAKSGVPSLSVAIVRNSHIVYAKAFGDARLDPKIAATPTMRYSIGSISKQFTATAILLLQEEGKLSLDDHVGKYFPDLTRANEVTIRQLLSHTSGYQDYWPEDYVMTPMLQPVTASQIMGTWGHKPLDFGPGTKWQYSNTNFVIAGAIVEKVAGKPLLSFLKEKVFTPLEMKSVTDTDHEKLPDTDPGGYLRYALGPLRPAPKEGRGWMFAAGELAMTARDLGQWDISVINRTIMKPASYDQLETEVLLKNGVSSHYGLGIGIGMQSGRRTLAHDGEVSGFTADNLVFPDDGVAVVALTNQDAASAGGVIVRSVVPFLFTLEDSAVTQKTDQARKIFEGLQRGTIDRSLFTQNANDYFSDAALKDFASSLAPFGIPKEFTQVSQGLRGGMTLRRYRIKFENKNAPYANRTLIAWTYEMPGGMLEQYQIAEQN